MSSKLLSLPYNSPSTHSLVTLPRQQFLPPLAIGRRPDLGTPNDLEGESTTGRVVYSLEDLARQRQREMKTREAKKRALQVFVRENEVSFEKVKLYYQLYCELDKVSLYDMFICKSYNIVYDTLLTYQPIYNTHRYTIVVLVGIYAYHVYLLIHSTLYSYVFSLHYYTGI